MSKTISYLFLSLILLVSCEPKKHFLAEDAPDIAVWIKQKYPNDTNIQNATMQLASALDLYLKPDPTKESATLASIEYNDALDCLGLFLNPIAKDREYDKIVKTISFNLKDTDEKVRNLKLASNFLNGTIDRYVHVPIQNIFDVCKFEVVNKDQVLKRKRLLNPKYDGESRRVHGK